MAKRIYCVEVRDTAGVWITSRLFSVKRNARRWAKRYEGRVLVHTGHQLWQVLAPALVLTLSLTLGACASPTSPTPTPVAVASPAPSPWHWDVFSLTPGCAVAKPVPMLASTPPANAVEVSGRWLVDYPGVRATFVPDPALKAGSYALCTWSPR